MVSDGYQFQPGSFPPSHHPRAVGAATGRRRRLLQRRRRRRRRCRGWARRGGHGAGRQDQALLGRSGGKPMETIGKRKVLGWIMWVLWKFTSKDVKFPYVTKLCV